MKIKLLSFSIANLISMTIAEKACEELTASLSVIGYCKNGSKCTIENIGTFRINNVVSCKCLAGYSLPDCSLRKFE